ncbi:DUF6036 family nucleotidyltransferase [Jiella sonneratiae]|uniref:DUF6036 domain-containing protein n=1 Tax=Jiella sonneratiae TaxID=2816856 RepID=A0ABS3J2R0_9HYPH|nr:DUF6036 family nucleotidyltransferase [Jiella sonneratiae]MBO0903942.1 hypothetical protein [Jiella sonneratiae]
MDHILRAAAEITGHKLFVLVGSAAVAVGRKNVPATMMITPEIDIYAPGAEDSEAISDLIESNIGRDSAFHKTHGYFADGVSPQTATMPLGWETRTTEYEGSGCPGVLVIVPDVNDIALAKLVAWREKDRGWLTEGARYSLLSLQIMADRLHLMPEADQDRGIPSKNELIRRIGILSIACKTEINFAPISEDEDTAGMTPPRRT